MPFYFKASPQAFVLKKKRTQERTDIKKAEIGLCWWAGRQNEADDRRKEPRPHNVLLQRSLPSSAQKREAEVAAAGRRASSQPA